MKDCRKCRSYKDCTGKPWYHYGAIRRCIYQVVWIREHSEILRVGTWPSDPDGAGYIDPEIKTGYKSEAYFEKPVGILAEVEYRLNRTGVSGKLLRAEVLAEVELSEEARDALMYCKGRRRKDMSFMAWKTQRNYYQKVK